MALAALRERWVGLNLRGYSNLNDSMILRKYGREMATNGGSCAVQRFWTWAGLVGNPKKTPNPGCVWEQATKATKKNLFPFQLLGSWNWCGRRCCELLVMNEPLTAPLINANHRGCLGSGNLSTRGLIPVWNKRLCGICSGVGQESCA